MIIDLNILAPRHAFVLVIMASEGCLLCHSLNLRLLLCHHARAIYGFLLPLPCYSGSGGHGRQGRLSVLFLKDSGRDSESQWVDLKRNSCIFWQRK